MEECRSTVRHYAVLIGINLYPAQPVKWSSLRGCVNDVRETEKYLKSHLTGIQIQAFTASSTEVSESPRPVENPEVWPTYDNITACLRRITSVANPGDFIYIHYSGHGSTIPPSSKHSNASTGDLALVVLDDADVPSVRYLRGLEFAYLLKAMVARQLTITLVLDCCFSGSVMRKGSSVRSLGYDPAVDAAYPAIPEQILDPQDEAGRPAYRDVFMRPNWLVDPDGYTILAACGPTEKAKELQSKDGKRHGILTYFLLSTLKELDGVKYKQRYIYPRVRARFIETQASRQNEQNPMLYGSKGLLFFGHKDHGVESIPIPIVQTLDKGLRLEAGQAHGIHKGDQFFVHALNSSNFLDTVRRDDSIVAQVSHVGPLTSVLGLLDGASMPSKIGLFALALTHLALREYPVRLQHDIPPLESWETVLRERSSLRIYNTNNSDDESPISFHVSIIDDQSYQIREGAKQVVTSQLTPENTHVQNISHILDVVEHLAFFRMVRNLTNESLTDPAHPFTKSFTVQLISSSGQIFHPACPQGCSHPGCSIEVVSGDDLELVVKNENNAGGDSLYLHIYNMGPSLEIEGILDGNHEVIPPRFSNQHQEFEQGTTGQWSRHLEMVIPPEAVEKGQFLYEDIIKIFLTDQPTSFLSLELPKLGSAREMSKTSRMRGGVSHLAGSRSSENWAAVNFLIRTRVRQPPVE